MLKSICVALKLCSTLSGPATVIDGDTIIVEGIHVRLRGLDAEELSEPHGREAKRYMQTLTQDDIIICRLNGQKSYDRYVGVCISPIGDLSMLMVMAGKALDCARYSKGQYRKYEPHNIRSTLIQKGYC